MNSQILNKIAANPASKVVYDQLLILLDGIGTYDIEPKQTSLHITNGNRAFLGVYPRQNGLLLSIVADHELSSPRFKKSEQLSKSRYHYDIVISDITELDDELMGWIQDSYNL